MYRLGVVLDVNGAKGLGTLKQTDAELTKVEKSGKRAEGTLSRFAGALNRVSSALKGNAGGAGDGGWLPGLAHVSNVIQGIPQIGQLAGALVSPLTNAAQAGIAFNAFLETTEIALKRHFGGSREATRGFVGEVRQFAQNSPFRTEGLIKTIIYGTATGFSPREALQLVKDVGDAIASTGDISEETVQGVVRALSQMKAKGTVSAEEMEQLAERGIPAWEMLANSIGKTVAETRKLSEQGRLNGPAAVAALRAEMRARYGGMMKELEDSLVGLQSAGDDRLQSAQAKATENLTKDLKRIYQAGLANFNEQAVAATINTAISPVSGLITTAAEGMLGGGLTSGLVKGITLGKSLVAGAVKDFALDGVIGTAKKWLGINSPSTVFAELGGHAVDGFAYGAQGRGGLASEESKEKLRRALEELLDDPRVQALIDTIGKGEGTFDPRTGRRDFNKIFGGRRVALGRKHPGIYVPFGNTTSSAAGLGQFLERTWNGVSGQLGGLDFSNPRDQQLAMVALMHQRKMLGPLLRGDTATALRRGNREWASLPGSPYGQPTQTMRGALSTFDQRLAAHGGFTVNNAPVSVMNPVPVSVVSGATGGSFNPTSAPQVIARAQRESAEVLPVFNHQIHEAISLMPTWSAEGANLGRQLHSLTTSTQRQELAAGHAAASVIQLAKSAESTGEKLLGMIGGLAGMLPGGGQQTGKRGFFSKMLGFAAPFLNFIPGVGPILSTLAGMGSAALAGDWGGVLTGAVSGLSPGGAFRGTGGGGRAPLPTSDHSGLNGVSLMPPGGSLPGRASGGPVQRGRAYMVGEYRTEVFEPDEDGFIHPSVESYRRSRGGMSGGGRGASGGWGAMIERLLRAVEENSATLSGIRSMPADHVLMVGGKSAAGQRAVADAYMSHAGRDPSAIDWMARRVAPQ